MTIKDRLEQHEKLVYFTLQKCFPDVANDEDLQQIGRIGLWNACRTYVPGKGEFSTYAVACIKNQVQKELYHQNAKMRKGVLVSLQEPLHDSPGLTLGDALSGDMDVCWIDLPGFWAALSDKQRTVARKVLAGYTFREIAEQSGVSCQAVQCTMQRVRQKARQFL